MNTTLKRWQMFILIFMILISLSTSMLILLDFDKPSYYNLLFVLPLIFGLYLLVYAKLFRRLFTNLGITMILGFMFIRLVISPLFKFLAGYVDTIKLNVEFNTPISIILVAYETTAIITVLSLLLKKSFQKENKQNFNNYLSDINKRYIGILFILIIIQIATFIYTPGLLDGYRSIFDIGDVTFTHLEMTYIIRKYSTSFGTKLSLVTGQYLMKLLRLLLPSVIIIWINREKKSKYRQALSYIMIIPQFFMIDGAIARSIIYTVILYLLINCIYPHNTTKKIGKILIISFIAVVFYWIFRFNLLGGEIVQYFSTKFNCYFSGVNIVSGSLNLPRDLELRVFYFIYDFLKSIPYGNTIFSLEQTDMGIYFNLINGTFGQIPTTIGTSYYYFGFLFAPTYSIIFAIMAYKMGEKANQTSNLISKTRYLFLTIYFSMGIIMYNMIVPQKARKYKQI